jgi:hypothetical protein
MLAAERDPYRTLGVDRDASILEIARARRRLAKRYHPDVASGSWATDRMREVNEAWSILADPSARLAWDQAHAQPPDPGVWVNYPPGPPRSAAVPAQDRGGNGWWWTLAAVVVLLVLVLVGGMIAAIDGPSPGTRDSPVLQDNLDWP